MSDFQASRSPPDSGTTQLLQAPPEPRQTAPAFVPVHVLVRLAGSMPGARIRLRSDPQTIGRMPECDVVLPEASVSRAHCQVRAIGGHAEVTDLGSTNGTFVDEQRIRGAAVLSNGALLRVGEHLFRCECRDERELERQAQAEEELVKAGRYVQALLPAPLIGGPVRTDWAFEPSARLGGDAFGHHALPGGALALYLVDVSGHGTDSALHAVAVINVLRHGALPGADCARPDQVLAGLNAMFPMQDHGGLYFSIWYGVYQPHDRLLRYASAGHPPAYLLAPAAEPLPLRTPNAAIGMAPGRAFQSAECWVTPRARLYIFSDGAFEIALPDGVQWQLRDFVHLLRQPTRPGLSEPQRLRRAVTEATGRDRLEDDFSLLVATFA